MDDPPLYPLALTVNNAYLIDLLFKTYQEIFLHNVCGLVWTECVEIKDTVHRYKNRIIRHDNPQYPEASSAGHPQLPH